MNKEHRTQYERLFAYVQNIVRTRGLSEYIDNYGTFREKEIKEGDYRYVLQQYIDTYHKHSFYEWHDAPKHDVKKPIITYDETTNILTIVAFSMFRKPDENFLKIFVEEHLDVINNKCNGIILDIAKHHGGGPSPILNGLYPIIGDVTLYGMIGKNPKTTKVETVWWNLKNGKTKSSFTQLLPLQKDLLWQKPLIIIASNKTASAGEHLGLAFQHRKNCTVIGTTPTTKGLLTHNIPFKIGKNDGDLILTSFKMINCKNEIVQDETLHMDIVCDDVYTKARELILFHNLH